MRDLVIIGAGGMGREAAWLVDEINERSETWNLLGFVDDNPELKGKRINGYLVLGGVEWLYGKDDIYYVCSIANPKIREAIVEKCEAFEIKPATLIHPDVRMSRHNKIGEGTIICASTIVTVNVNIGRHVIVNLGCTICHDSIIDDFCSLYPNINVSGNVNISKSCEIGTGSQIIQSMKIGANSIVGAGSVVVKNIPANSTSVGIPAKPIKFR